MAQSVALSFGASQTLASGWSMLVAEAGAYESPRQIPQPEAWIDAPVPGTAEQALRMAGRKAPRRLHDCDVWYRCVIDGVRGAKLTFDGLATIATVFVDGVEAARSCSMFLPVEFLLEKDGPCELAIRFHALNPWLARQKGKRARWRTSLVDNPALRFARTTFLGHMPGWCPAVDIVGPYRNVWLTPPGLVTQRDVVLSPGVESGVPILRAEVPPALAASLPLALQCAEATTPFFMRNGTLVAELSLPHADRWMPHTHGNSNLYEAALLCGSERLPLGNVGFRDIIVDHGEDGSRFGFIVNGEPVFARGVCWTPADIVSLPCNMEAYRHEFEMLRAAGVNMIRVPGITLYEADAFFEAADEFGILVWQDLQLANFDYPFADPDFAEAVCAEMRRFLARTSRHCALAVVCGGSEIMQQAAMLGLPEVFWRNAFLETGMCASVAALRPDIAYVANSPCGGALPFFADHGVAHYYGVGAYLRPLEDARRANVSFAAECLAFSNVPENATLRAELSVPPVHHPKWKDRVPRDRGASWDFEDVREHYMSLLYGIDCQRLRREDPARYLDFARATTAEVIEATYSEWRRPQSTTAGALIFLWKDLHPGAGWGVTDATGRPKSPWYAMQRAFRPVFLGMTDEGSNGLALYLRNETPRALSVVLELECLTLGRTSAASGKSAFVLSAHSNVSLNAVELLGAFFDTNYAYRFGPAAHDVVAARLSDAETSQIYSEAFSFPQGRGVARHDLGLQAEVLPCGESYALALSTDRFAQSICIDDEAYVPMENYFHLSPGTRKIVALKRFRATQDKPTGAVSALNGVSAVRY